MRKIRIATRGSRLALAQAHRVAEMVRARAGVDEVELVEVPTLGDRDRTTSLSELSEVGAFVRAVQEALLDRRADLAVHSLKDLPVTQPEGLEIVAYPERRSPHDVLVGCALDSLPPGSRVGTSSPRRAAQLRQLRPDLSPVPMRGNVDTRLAKVADGEFAAAILAEAGLERLGRADAVTERFGFDRMVPAPGQGALAVEAATGTAGAAVGGALDDPSLRLLLHAERLLLAETGAGCRSALGAVAEWDDGIRLTAFVSDEKGSRRAVVWGESPEEVVATARKELGL
ncbi:MAG: hydroxymethylbilane synthase [Actinomycetes bacterium]|jgi:hydroxymethylbilane synthase|nr:hydroxymethylbilane synthase [Acidimicrobiia bacterium]